MRLKIHSVLIRMLSLMTACLFCMTSCHKPEEKKPSVPDIFEKVNILYSAGHNDLTSYLKDDIDELAESAVKYWKAPDEVFIVFSHLAKNRYNFEPVESRITKVQVIDGVIRHETLKTFPIETISTDPETLNEVLSYIKENFPAKEYNLIFSSHCSGYLPAGYLNHYDEIERDYKNGDMLSYRIQRAKGPLTYPAVAPTSGPLTKAIGADYNGSMSSSVEMDLKDFAEAIPMKMNAVIFDACFMGGIEVAYELRDKCNYLIASPSEILADGMVYTAMGKRIFGGKSDFPGLCEDYYNHYNKPGTFYESGGIITLIDCSKLEPLAMKCHELFGKYREAINSVNYNRVQRFYRTGIKHFHGFYDLNEIMKQAGCDAEDLEELDSAIRESIIYKAATPGFITGYGGFDVSSYCGLSMYLPSHKGRYGNGYLNSYYKELAWNKATGLVQ